MQKIIIFEDDKMLSEMYKAKFENAGFEVVYFEYPPEDIVNTILNENPDLISMSVIMPNCDGFTATEKIKKDIKTKDIPLVFLTTCNQKEDIQKGLALGAADYFAKSEYHPDDLIKKYKKIINGERSTGTMRGYDNTIHDLPIK